MPKITNIKLVPAEYIESGTFQGGEEDVSMAEIEYGEKCLIVSAKHKKLIESSPELLALCCELLKFAQGYGGLTHQDMKTRAERLIAKLTK